MLVEDDWARPTMEVCGHTKMEKMGCDLRSKSNVQIQLMSGRGIC